MNYTLPLFPLNLVVYPQSFYPLHIFEERYKLLVSKCIKEDSEFGIIAIDKESGKLQDIGTKVKVYNVLKLYDNHEFDIVVQGTGRFKLLEHSELVENEVAEGVVEDYIDTNPFGDQQKISRMFTDFEHFKEKLSIPLDAKFYNALETARCKSFKIAEKVGFELEQQLTLIAIRDENVRLQLLTDYMAEFLVRYELSKAVEKIVIGDGYLEY